MVTGGAGHLGSSLVERLLEEENYRVTVVDNLSTGHEKNLTYAAHDRCEFVKCDANELRDMQEVMLSRRFDAVFHLAAVVGVQRTQEFPVSVLRDIDDPVIRPNCALHDIKRHALLRRDKRLGV